MTRPRNRSSHRSEPSLNPAPVPVSQLRRSRRRRATRTTVGAVLLLAAATGVTVGAAAYSKNAASPSSAIAPAAAETSASPDVRNSDVASTEQEAHDLAERGQSREVIPGLSVKIGDLRIATDPSGVRATTLPLNVVNTGSLTRSFDITVVAISDKGEVITSDVGTAANLRPGQAAEIPVLEIVNDALADQLSGATFRIEEAYAY